MLATVPQADLNRIKSNLLTAKECMDESAYHPADSCTVKPDKQSVLFDDWSLVRGQSFRYAFESAGMYTDGRYAFIANHKLRSAFCATGETDERRGQTVVDTLKAYFANASGNQVYIIGQSTTQLVLADRLGKRVAINANLYANAIKYGQITAQHPIYYSFEENTPVYVCCNGETLAIIMPLKSDKDHRIMITEPKSLHDVFRRFPRNTIEFTKTRKKAGCLASESDRVMTATVRTGHGTIHFECSSDSAGRWTAFAPTGHRKLDFQLLMSRGHIRPFKRAMKEFSQYVSHAVFVGVQTVVALPAMELLLAD